MTHLDVPDDLSVIKREVDANVRFAPKDVGEEIGPNPMDEEIFTFQFDWTDRRGKRWTGEFTNQILTIGDHARVGAFRARLQGGLPFSAIPPDIADINLALAWLTFSLKKKPVWSEPLDKLKDPDLLGQIFEKVSAHEARYFRRDETPTEG
jgi:hypothetical protein